MYADIVNALKVSPGYLSGEELSSSLKISRTAVWKYIQELRRLGYDIAAVPHLGYQLLTTPDRLFPWEIQYQLGTRTMGRKIIYEEVVSSTMDEAFRHGLEGAAAGTLICAETQLKGRGRLGRSWVSPKGKGIYGSLILRPSLGPNDVAKLTLLAGVALCEAVRSSTKVAAQIKWPNDLLVGKKKLAGILTELNAEMERVKFVVIGFGVNVNTPESQLPQGSTSLKIESGQALSRVEFLKEVLRSFERWNGILGQEGFSSVLKRWKELSITLGRRVRITDPSSVVEGEAQDIDDDGGLLIRQDTGLIVKKMAGEVAWAH